MDITSPLKTFKTNPHSQVIYGYDYYKTFDQHYARLFQEQVFLDFFLSHNKALSDSVIEDLLLGNFFETSHSYSWVCRYS